MRILLIFVVSLILSTSLFAAESNLKGKSELAQKRAELDALDKKISELETAAGDATVKDRAEIAQKKAEISELDKDIREMKSRLGTISVHSNDNADAIRLMTDQKTSLGKEVEELLKKNYQENKGRWSEISRLKTDYNNKGRDLINKAVVNYQKVVTNTSDQYTKDVAWEEFVTLYPESNKLPRHNLEEFLSTQGLVLSNGKVVSARSIVSEKQKSLPKVNSAANNNVCNNKCDLDKNARDMECLRTMTPSDVTLLGPLCLQRAIDYYNNCKKTCLNGP